MRKLIVSNAVSLDGYYAGPDGDVMVLELDPVFDAYNAERLRAADTLLLGRNSFEGFKGFWPPIADDPVPNWSDAQREVSRRDNEIDESDQTLRLMDTRTWEESGNVLHQYAIGKGGQ